MEDEEIILQQTRKIAELEFELAEYKRAIVEIHNVLFCIGGPLNDNKQGYTKEQRSTFHSIASIIDF